MFNQPNQHFIYLCILYFMFSTLCDMFLVVFFTELVIVVLSLVVVHMRTKSRLLRRGSQVRSQVNVSSN